MTSYTSLVLDGGGIRAISYIGVFKYLQEKQLLHNIKNFAGTSSGSQAAALLSIGYSIRELEHILLTTEFEDFMDSDDNCCHNICSFLYYYGYYKGNKLRDYLEKLIKIKLKKKNATFLDLWKFNNHHLKVTGTCLETKKLLIFDYINTPNMIVSKALHISSCIPFFFKPVKHEGLTYVDGGCLRNFPINIFNEKEGKTIGIELISDNDNKLNEIIDFKSFAFSVVDTIHSAANNIEINKQKHYVITINTGEISAIDFKINMEKKRQLITNSYQTIKNNFII